LLKFVTADSKVESQPSGTFPPATLNPQLTARFGDYELLEVLARGGMGVVYKARQVSLNRTVALKMIQAGLLASPAEVKRFHAEAEAVAHLQHPNIVAVHEIGEHNGQHYFSMDYVTGRTLADVVRDGPLPALRAATYAKTIASAVHYAHQHGIIHRDLKPANIILDEHDQPHITDFGLAKRLSDSQLSTLNPQLTLSGQVLGSPNYLPPEQAEPKRGPAGPASDVYALGAILYHLVTGRPPFQAESLTTLLRQVIESDPVVPRSLNPGIPRDLETICLKCLEKEPHRRYASAQALADDLDRFLNHQPVLARPINPTGRVWRWCRRQPVRAGLIAALVLVFVAGTAAVLWQWRQAATQRRAAVAAGAEAQIGEYAASIATAQSMIQARQFPQARDTLLARTRQSYRGWEWGWLLRSCNQDLMTLSENQSLGVEAVFSPDSRLLVTSGFDPVLQVWDLATGEAIRRLPGHTGVANMTSFSPDGRRLCTFSWAPGDRTVRFWDMATDQVLFGPIKAPSAINYGALSRDGRRLATAGADGKVRVYDAATGADTGLVNDYGDAVNAVAFSPDGRRIAYAGGDWYWTRSQDTSIRIWDLVSGDTKRLVGHKQAVYGLAWSPDGALLVSCGFDWKIKAWDPDSGTELPPFEASPKQRAMLRADFSPDSRLLGVVGTDDPHPTAFATLFDVRTRRVFRELPGHSAEVQGIRFSPDGQYVATSSTEGIVKIWPVSPLPDFLSLEGHSQTVWTAAFSPDGSRVATGSLDQTARIWDATNGALLRTFVVRFPVVSLAFSHDGQRLVTVGPDNAACIWDLQNSDATSENPPGFGVRQSSAALGAGPNSEQETAEKEPGDWRSPRLLSGHTRAVMAVAWSPDDRWIATGGKDRTAKIADANTGAARLTLVGHSDSVSAVAFTPDGKVLATGSADGTARLWSTSSAQCLHVLTNHSGAVLSLAFSPDGHLLATGSADGSARLWETSTGRQLHLLSGHLNVSSVGFSPDGQRLVTTSGVTNLHSSGGRVFKVFLWDVASGRQFLTLHAHDNVVYGAAFSPDGHRLVTASADNTARIWTAFPWRSTDYAGDANAPLASRVEQFKRQFWRAAIAAQKTADALERPWTNGFHVYHHSFGDMNLPAPGSKTSPLFPIPPRPAQAGSDQVDLTGRYNVALNETWQPLANLADVDFSLAALPPGLQSYGGVAFDARGTLQLRWAAPDSELYPDRVTIPLGRVFHRLHAFHGTTGFEPDGHAIGAFVLHYTDGQAVELLLVSGEHLRGIEDSRSDCPSGQMVWPSAPVKNAGPQLRLYHTTFLNPKPELNVVSVEYVSKLTRCGPFLVALTVE
jgi:WD40 repeat protein/predicted Ser/Thr protein kinase